MGSDLPLTAGRLKLHPSPPPSWWLRFPSPASLQKHQPHPVPRSSAPSLVRGGVTTVHWLISKVLPLDSLLLVPETGVGKTDSCGQPPTLGSRSPARGEPAVERNQARQHHIERRIIHLGRLATYFPEIPEPGQPRKAKKVAPPGRRRRSFPFAQAAVRDLRGARSPSALCSKSAHCQRRS